MIWNRNKTTGKLEVGVENEYMLLITYSNKKYG